MTEKREGTHSQMFTLRVWVEDVGNGRTEIRGTLKHILSGETHNFRDWTGLITIMEQRVAGQDTAAPKTP